MTEVTSAVATTEAASSEVNPLLVNGESTFTFRPIKETGYKRPNVAVIYPTPSLAGVLELLKNPESKEAKLIVGLAQDVVTGYVRGFVDEDQDFDQAKLDELIADGKIDFAKIANLPRSERNVLSRADLEEFAKVYIKLMPSISGKELVRVQTAAGILVERLKRAAGDNAMLSVLQGQLALFAEKAPTEVVEEHIKAISFLQNKMEELLAVKITADSL